MTPGASSVQVLVVLFVVPSLLDAWAGAAAPIRAAAAATQADRRRRFLVRMRRFPPKRKQRPQRPLAHPISRARTRRLCQEPVNLEGIGYRTLAADATATHPFPPSLAA